MMNVRRNSGFTLLEAITALGIVAIVASIGVGSYVAYLRSAETVDVISTIAVMREQIGITASGQETVTCDNTMVSAGGLENPYIDLAMTPVAVDPANVALGAVPGLTITAKVDTHGPEGIATAGLLLEELQGQGVRIIEPVRKDSFVFFSVVLNETPICDVASLTSTTQAPIASVTGVQALSPPASLSVAEAQAASTIVNVGMNDPVFAGAIAAALAKAQLSGDAVSLPGSPEAAATLAKCSIPTPTPCQDNYTGDCQVDFPGMCTDPVRACAAARICPQTCGYCQGVSPEMQAFLDKAYDNLLQMQGP
jgi:prepilin-type N-terminal cleavage/methylation domain-containing protein